MKSALLETKSNGALSLTRVVLVTWVAGLLVSYFWVLYLIVNSPIIALNGVEQFKHDWSRYGGAFAFGATTFGAMVVQYLGKKWVDKR